MIDVRVISIEIMDNEAMDISNSEAMCNGKTDVARLTQLAKLL